MYSIIHDQKEHNLHIIAIINKYTAVYIIKAVHHLRSKGLQCEQ